MTVFPTYITIARPLGDNPGKIEPGHFTVASGTVTLTDPDGKPLASGRLQLGYTAKIGAGETERQVANRLLWRKYQATKSGADFNRQIEFKNYGIV